MDLQPANCVWFDLAIYGLMCPVGILLVQLLPETKDKPLNQVVQLLTPFKQTPNQLNYSKIPYYGLNN